MMTSSVWFGTGRFASVPGGGAMISVSGTARAFRASSWEGRRYLDRSAGHYQSGAEKTAGKEKALRRAGLSLI
jgi:hypothetical protein